jgi:hypothetical protein
VSTRPTECGYCNADHGSAEPCPVLDKRARRHPRQPRCGLSVGDRVRAKAGTSYEGYGVGRVAGFLDDAAAANNGAALVEFNRHPQLSRPTVVRPYVDCRDLVKAGPPPEPERLYDLRATVHELDGPGSDGAYPLMGDGLTADEVASRLREVLSGEGAPNWLTHAGACRLAVHVAPAGRGEDLPC